MKKNASFLLLVPLLSGFSISLVGCNQQTPDKEFKTYFYSKSLQISNLIIEKNNDFIAQLSFINPNYNYCLPKTIDLYVGQKYIDQSQYVFNNITGEIHIDKSLITDDLTILAEWRLIDGYQIHFEKDEHIHFYFYPTRDYSIEPVEDQVAIARDPQTGMPSIDDNGEVNFKYVIDENYESELFWMHGVCDDIIEVSGYPGIYRISHIKDNIQIRTKTQRIYCHNLCASAKYDDRSFSFHWDLNDPTKVDSVIVSYNVDDQNKIIVLQDVNDYTITDVQPEKLYHFTFTPKLSDGTDGGAIEKDMMLSPESLSYSFPRIEITTENNLLPMYNTIDDLYLDLPSVVVNSEYVNNIIRIYNSQNEEVYDSSESLLKNDDFSGSQIEVYDNLSIVNLTEKKTIGKESYKIHLSEQADLLDNFLNHSQLPYADAYKHNEWLLLNCGNQLNEIGGLSIEKTLESIWVPLYQYVTLFVNNDFKGLYVLCESITPGNISGTFQSRCPISDSGFIIQNNGYPLKENISFKSHINQLFNGMEYTFKYPDPENGDIKYDDEEFKKIKQSIDTFEKYFYNISNDDKYKDYIDIDSFVRWTIAHDLMHVMDFLGSDMYIYKKDDTITSKLTAGTTWNFDSAFIPSENPSDPRGKCYHRSSVFYYIRGLARDNDFKVAEQALFDAKKDSIVNDFLGCVVAQGLEQNIYNKLLEKESIRFKTQQSQFNNQLSQITTYLNVQIKFIEQHPYIE